MNTASNSGWRVCSHAYAVCRRLDRHTLKCVFKTTNCNLLFETESLAGSPSRTVSRSLSLRQLRDGNGLQDARSVMVLQRRPGIRGNPNAPAPKRSFV